ncbi:hypothetical protein [Christiangramia sp.]|uniref:hypothetical protein n=1 Tax=Christiangramia sp. TaxID=1931228 RepID=UPI002616FC46|nr:hypothetical protein [Christiangramia sp.]
MECTARQYIESKKSLEARIIAIDALIDAMILSLADYAAGQNTAIEEYQMDDGQMKIRTRYRTPGDVDSGIKALERMKQMYVNRYNGRTFLLRDNRSFRR